MSEIREKIENMLKIHCDRHDCCMEDDKSKIADQILSLLPNIDMIEHVGKCECGTGYVQYDDPKDDLNFGTIPCPNCQGTGETTRPATLEDIVNCIKDKLESTYHFNVIAKSVSMPGIQLPSGGILRIKEGKG